MERNKEELEKKGGIERKDIPFRKREEKKKQILSFLFSFFFSFLLFSQFLGIIEFFFFKT